MGQTFGLVAVFLLFLIALPFGIKWIQRRAVNGIAGTTSDSKVLSVAAIGPHQRIVTVEVGPVGHRIWLVLGVTAQNVVCLHKVAPTSNPESPEQVLVDQHPKASHG